MLLKVRYLYCVVLFVSSAFSAEIRRLSDDVIDVNTNNVDRTTSSSETTWLPLSSTSWTSFGNVRETTSCAERDTPGLICSNCDTVALCVQGGGGWQTIPVARCEGEEKCNLKEQGCSTKPGPCKNNPPDGQTKSIKCKAIGLLPDPYDCQRYHVCAKIDEQSSPQECGGNKSYDARTKECTETISTSTICREFVPVQCEKPGQSGPWLTDPNMFYVCVADTQGQGQGNVLRPEIHRCEHGTVYQGADKGCVKNGAEDKPPQSTVPEICTELGKFPDPKDEEMYYHCKTIGEKPKHKSCDWGETFDPVKLKCVCDDWWCDYWY